MPEEAEIRFYFQESELRRLQPRLQTADEPSTAQKTRPEVLSRFSSFAFSITVVLPMGSVR